MLWTVRVWKGGRTGAWVAQVIVSEVETSLRMRRILVWLNDYIAPVLGGQLEEYT